jgi:low temperature requirement protein LtrA
VFVFAVTQLSHTLVADLTLTGMLRVTLLLLAVWWVWIYTSWVTNWLDPERIPVRACLLVLLVAGLVMSVSIPHAFDELGLYFAGAYAFMQVGRTLFFLWAVRGGPATLLQNFQRILVWLGTSGALWIAGAYCEGWSRFGLWLVALAIEFAGPWCYFAVPGLGRSTTADWNVHGGHLG